MLEFETGGVERKYPHCDYEYIGTSEWAYGLADDTFEKTVCDSGLAALSDSDGYVF